MNTTRDSVKTKNAADQNSHVRDGVKVENETNKVTSGANPSNAEDIDNELVDYDRIITAAGEFGAYQLFLTCCTFPFYAFGVFAYFGQMFLTEASSDHWCLVPELENLTALERRSLAIPLKGDSRFGYSQCEMYVANWTEVLLSVARPDNTWKTQPCRDGWEFNLTEIPYPTITSEMGWVCERSSYQATAQAIFFVGSVAGGLIFGWVSDRFGRIAAAVSSNAVGCVAGVASIFSTNFLQFTICRFVMGMSYDSCMMMTYLLVLEFVAPKYRSLMANLPFAIFYTLAATALPWIALGCGHWKTLSLATSLPMGLALLTPLIMPESPKWLLIKGRVDDVSDQMIKVARINKKEIPVELIEQFKASAATSQSVETKSLLDLIKHPTLRSILIYLCIEYMCCMMIFDALLRTLGSLQFDFFLSFTLVSLTECPSLILISFILDLTGRKWLTISCFTVCCVFCFVTIFVSAGVPSVVCAVVARFATNMVVNIAYQWSAEMLPTPVRGSAVGFIHITGFIATILSPYIAYTEHYVQWMPSALICAIAVVGGASALALPETAGKPMSQTFEDAEVLYRDKIFFDVPFLRTKVASSNEAHHNPSFEMS